MTKNEALKAAIDGKKIRPKIQTEHLQFIFFNPQKNHFMTMWDSGEESSKGNCWVDCLWEIVPEYVDFAEAWKAYEAGKTIQSTSSGEKYQNKQYGAFIRVDAIRGKWLILEDE